MATVRILRDASGDRRFRCEWGGPPDRLVVQRGETIEFKKVEIPEPIFIFVATEGFPLETLFGKAVPQPFADATRLVASNANRPDGKPEVPDETRFKWAVTADPDPSKREQTLADLPGGNGAVSGP